MCTHGGLHLVKMDLFMSAGGAVRKPDYGVCSSDKDGEQTEIFNQVLGKQRPAGENEEGDPKK